MNCSAKTKKNEWNSVSNYGCNKYFAHMSKHDNPYRWSTQFLIHSHVKCFQFTNVCLRLYCFLQEEYFFPSLKRWQRLKWSAWASFTSLFPCLFLSSFLFLSLRFIQRQWTNELNSGRIFRKWDSRDAKVILNLQCQCCSAQLHFTNCHFIWH